MEYSVWTGSSHTSQPACEPWKKSDNVSHLTWDERGPCPERPNQISSQLKNARLIHSHLAQVFFILIKLQLHQHSTERVMIAAWELNSNR